LRRTDAGGWRPIYEIKPRWVKNNHDPESIVGSVIVSAQRAESTKDQSTMMPPSSWPWLSPMMLSLDTCLDDIRKQEIPLGENELILSIQRIGL
jgi:hypothetical protein